MGLIVAGASGFIGRHVIRAAMDRKEAVLPVVRSRPRTAELGIGNVIEFDELSSARLRDAGFDACPILHLSGASRDMGSNTIEHANVYATEIIVEAAVGARSSRIIYLSGYGVTHLSSDPYFRAKARAEDIIRASGIPYTIFRSSYILGSGDELTPYLVAGARSGMIRLPGDGRPRLQPVWIGDIVDVLLNAARSEGCGNHDVKLLGEAISLGELSARLAAHVSTKAGVTEIGLEEFLREALSSENPEFTTGELALLVSDIIGPRTDSCYGVRIRGFDEILLELKKCYEPHANC